ncbi:hypothetical protein [Legionella parisiensis]|nr:hypothetical protein [Legionella parisiensis]
MKDKLVEIRQNNVEQPEKLKDFINEVAEKIILLKQDQECIAMHH